MVKKIAAIVTEYRKWSHADVILRNLLDGYPDGKRPGMDLVALYTDQVPKTDMSRALAKKHGFTIYDTIAECLTRGGKMLAVDGVLSIGEHGTYPANEKGQRLYPRRRFFQEITRVFEKSDKVVPVFNDKHLAPTWGDAKWMYDRACKLMIPFMAGSSIPVTWRKPDLTLPRGCEISGAVQIGYGPFEAYGFHALEGLQCMVERRKGGETGVKAVTCHTGKTMWDAFDTHTWAKTLLDAGLALVKSHAAGNMRDLSARDKDAGIFEIEYRDGLRAFVVMPNGWIHENDGASFYFTGQRKGQDKPEVCQYYLQQPDPFAHFAELTKAIDSLMQTNHAPSPVERTLLTTGMLDAVMTSRHESGMRIETPYLEIKYTATEWNGAKGEIPKTQET